MTKPTVLVASPSGAGCDRLRAMLEQSGKLKLRSHVMHDGSLDDIPAALGSDTDLLVIEADAKSVIGLPTWVESMGHRPPAMIVIGASDDSIMMRHAMHAGAKDYLAEPLDPDELLAAVLHVISHVEHEEEDEGDRGRLTAVINAKGGSGASVIASNLAHILCAFMDRETALIDMDLQFGALPLSFDLESRDSLLDVIGAIEQLDPVALRGYMTRHQSDLEILGSMSEQLVMPWEVSGEDIRRLLDLSVHTYDHVVVDLPREINPVSGVVLSTADRILLVMQQSFAHLRDAKRMSELLTTYLGVPSHKISIVMNRHTDRNPITVDDVRDAVHPSEIMFIPNDYVSVTDSMNVGVPLYQKAKNAPITRSLCRIAERVDESAGKVKKVEPKAHRWAFPKVLGLNG